MEDSRIIKRFMSGGKVSIADNITICIAATLAAAFYAYEAYFPFAAGLYSAAFALMVIMWVFCALISGKERKTGFVIFSVLFWTLPYVYTVFYESRDNAKGYSKVLSIINHIMTSILNRPFFIVSANIDIEPATVSVLFLLTVVAVYMVGFLLANFYDRYYNHPVEADDSDESDYDEEEYDDSRDDVDIVYKGERYLRSPDTDDETSDT